MSSSMPEITIAETPSKRSTATPTIVVVGNGMVGHHFLDSIEKQNSSAKITVLAAEDRPAYDRVHLSEVFGGRAPEDLALASREDYLRQGVDARFGDAVASIDRDRQTVTTAAGTQVPYDALVLATGSYPFVPPIPGSDLPECLVYRTIDDLAAIREASAQAKTGVVIGGGLLGLECANALRNLGLDTHVVEFAPGLMNVQLDEDGSAMLRHKVQELGLHVHTSKVTERIAPGEVGGVVLEFAEGEPLAADVVVFSAGIRPHDELARVAGLDCGERGGVVVDECCRTSDRNIYAIGECALFNQRIFGLVAPGYRMAEVAADQIAGQQQLHFADADMSTKLKLLGVDVGSIGDAHGREPGSFAYRFTDPIRNVYLRLNVNADGNRVTGAVLVGDCEAYDTILQFFLNDMALPEQPETLLLPQGDGGPALSADALPDTATICSCHNVSKGQILACIDSGLTTVAGVKAETGASSGCGGCAVLLKSVVDTQLESLGIEVDRSICEHFPYTREEIFHIVKVNGIRNFHTLIAEHGNGRGCDICKPAVASILASLYNDHVLNKKLVGLQDTNDVFLANMQKNGTYSVVPRVPGGEITPQKLIVLGEVARDFDLYTKITGGQRVDLFGARVDELPKIWRRLVDAGFETGHAYGKALRTVKSCVGSSWCRYGVQDSVSMALFIENRYKGVRSPHKVKMAVSGCTRECAEAQCKDFGVIATENGWNLFVGGNGGMRPRHAGLFATDLDDETLIAYIDRALMFYVRTAERLQRTSVWLENLEGGLDYLRSVVIDDRLGINVELERQMEHLAGTYQCEWKSTIDDPEKLKRFVSFVNADSPDKDLAFVRERGQRRPATEQEKADQIVMIEEVS